MAVYDKNVIFTDTIVEHIEEIERLLSLIQYDKKHMFKNYEEKIINRIDNTCLYLDKTRKELDYLEEVYNKLLKITNKTIKEYQEVKPS